MARLRLDGAAVADIDSGAAVDPVLSPRPYLHPVRTLAQTVVTEVLPEDHLHHLGVGITIADVSGTSFWGGRTFTRDRGSVLLDNHGRQEHVAWTVESDAGRTAVVAWTDTEGTELLREERATSAHGIDSTTWALDLNSTVRNTSGRTLTIGSPATNGRPGAAYGGFFWRAPMSETPPRCFGSEPGGEEALHESRAEWLALAGTTPEGAPWTLVFFQAGAERDPWFLRAAEYPGVGTSLAWDRVLEVPVDGAVERRTVTLVVDGHPGTAAVAALVATARERVGAPA
ncbi:PmoA family protein [Nocardiopsis ansamitocini]|nr:PmoA family protein [Nocardiopsis ansamitocini]